MPGGLFPGPRLPVRLGLDLARAQFARPRAALYHNEGMPDEGTPRDRFSSRTATLVATGLAIASVVIPFWFWMDTWFGKTLSDVQISEYLADNERPRRAQHAMAQISGRLSAGDESVRAWYPALLEIARHELPELRVTVAWLMGDDPESEEFHSALLELVADPNPLVRRNAALALAKFGDPTGRNEMRAMLQPYRLRSPHQGSVRNRLQAGDAFDAGALLVRIEQADGEEPYDVRAPIPGVVGRQLRDDGDQVETGDELTLVQPEGTHVLQALLGLYLVGTEEDLELVQPYQRLRGDFGQQVAQQARLTLERIRSRPGDQSGESGSGGTI